METTMLYVTKHASSQKDTLKLLDSTLPKHLHPLSELNPSVPSSLLQLSTIYTFSTQMLKQHFSMATAILNSTLSSPKDSWIEVIPTKFYGFEKRCTCQNTTTSFPTASKSHKTRSSMQSTVPSSMYTVTFFPQCSRNICCICRC